MYARRLARGALVQGVAAAVVAPVADFSMGGWTVAKGRETARRSIDDTLQCLLGKEWAEKGEPSLAGTVCESGSIVVGGGLEASNSSCRLVRGTNRLSRCLQSVELYSGNSAADWDRGRDRDCGCGCDRDWDWDWDCDCD